MRPLAAVGEYPVSKPGWPVVTLSMVDEAMRVARQRHPWSTLAMVDPAIWSVAPGRSQQSRKSPVLSPPKPQRMVESPAPQPEEMKMVDADEPQPATTWLSPRQAPTDAGSKAGPAVAESGDKPDDGKEDDASLPASGPLSETPKPGPSPIEETVEPNGSADPAREPSPRAAAVTGRDVPTGHARPAI